MTLAVICQCKFEIFSCVCFSYSAFHSIFSAKAEGPDFWIFGFLVGKHKVGGEGGGIFKEEWNQPRRKLSRPNTTFTINTITIDKQILGFGFGLQ